MKYNIKKEQDEELRHIKGLMNQSFNQFLLLTNIIIDSSLLGSLLDLFISRILFLHGFKFRVYHAIDELFGKEVVDTSNNRAIGEEPVTIRHMEESIELVHLWFRLGRVLPLL